MPGIEPGLWRDRHGHVQYLFFPTTAAWMVTIVAYHRGGDRHGTVGVGTSWVCSRSDLDLMILSLDLEPGTI